jgi:DNA-directed RNA polymerase subunit RPC12/RpoP
MLRVSLPFLICLYLFLFTSFVFLVWLRDGWRRRRREELIYRNRMRCQICANDFEESSDRLLVRCPQCGAVNERCRLGLL